MKIPVCNGHGQRIGMLELEGEIAAGTTHVALSLSSGYNLAKMMTVAVSTIIPFGWVVNVKWKQKAQLERAGLLLPYEPQEWEIGLKRRKRRKR
jgi:hypothetical protein